MHTSKKDYPVRVKELQERVQLAPALLAAFPLYATDNNAVHVVVETLSHCSEAERGELFAALRGVVEKSLEQPDVALEEGVQDVLCVVTRYFGGILLGAGGLCRAYTKAAKDALDDAGISELRPWSVLHLACPYALFERVKLELEKHSGLLRDTDYSAEIAMTVLLPEPEEAAFAAALRELSAGSLCPERTGTELHGVKIR